MFTILNRLRGTYTIMAKVNAVIIGLIFWQLTTPLIGSLIAIGYLAGESMGWGEWIGGLIRDDGSEAKRRDGDKNGIQWIATRFTKIDSHAYHFLSLSIRGFYWWGLALSPLFLVASSWVVALSIFLLAVWFPISVWVAKDFVITGDQWKDGEWIYGFIQDIIILVLILEVI